LNPACKQTFSLQRPLLRRCAGVLLLVLLASCGGETTPPEQQVRALVAAAEAAAEARKLSALADMVADEYADGYGRSRRDVVRLIAGYLLGHHAIHLLSHAEAIEFPAADRARLVVYLGISARPLESAEALSSLRLDLYRLELELARQDGEWRLLSGQWRRARGEDILRKLQQS